MNYALAANCYGPKDPRAAKSLMKAVVLAERRGFHMTADLSVFFAHLIMGRNRVHKAVLNDKKRDYEGVLWVDSDIIMPTDAIVQLLSHGKDFVSGVYFKRGDEHEPLIGQFYQQEIEGKAEKEWWGRYRRAFGPGQGLIQIPQGTCGFGFVYTANEVLELHAQESGSHTHAPGPFTKLPFIGEPGDDFSFCFRTTVEKQHPLWVDTDLLLDHQMESGAVGFQDFVAAAMASGKMK